MFRHRIGEQVENVPRTNRDFSGQWAPQHKSRLSATVSISDLVSSDKEEASVLELEKCPPSRRDRRYGKQIDMSRVWTQRIEPTSVSMRVFGARYITTTKHRSPRRWSSLRLVTSHARAGVVLHVLIKLCIGLKDVEWLRVTLWSLCGIGPAEKWMDRTRIRKGTRTGSRY